MKAWGLWLYGTTTMYTDVITVHCSPAGRLNIIALGIDLGAGCYRLSGLHQFSLVTQSCPTLCDPMNCSTPGLPVHHQLPEFTQTHVHWVSDAIQLSHPLLSPSPPTFNLSQHQMGQFVTLGSHSIGVSITASVLLMNIQDWFPLGLTGCISLKSKGLSRVFFNTIVQKHWFFSAKLSL